MNQLDYSALHRKIGAMERVRSGNGWQITVGVVTVLVLVLLTIMTGIGSEGRYLNGAIQYGVITIIVAIVTVVAYRAAGRRIRLHEFAVQNGMWYSAKVAFDDRAGIIFQQGRRKRITEILVAHDRNFSEMGSYEYKTGFGRYEKTYRFGFMRLPLPRHLPNMVLDSKKNNTFGRFSNLPIAFSADQRLSLEGDFDKYFTLYAPAEYKTDALYIFTPDVMQAMIDAVHEYDCEVIDNDFYIYTNGNLPLTKQERLEELLNIASKVKVEIGKQATNYADTRINNRSIDMVAKEGSRLKTRLTIGAVIGIVLFVLQIIFQMNPNIFTMFFTR